MASFDGSYTALCAWDCSWYKSIVKDGYDLAPHAHAKGDAANWAFFPVLPLLAALLRAGVAMSPELSLVVVGKIFFLASIFAFIQFARSYSSKISPWLAGAVVALNPYAIYGNTGYTESIFLLLTCIAFRDLKHGRYLSSGAAGAVLGATRVVGILFLVAYVIEVARKLPRMEKPERNAVALGALLVPLGLALFMVFLHFHMGDALAFKHVQKAWGRLPQNPLVHIVEGFSGGSLYLLWVAMILAALCVPAVLWLQNRRELAVFSMLCTIIPLSTALWSMPRYIWWQAPILLLVAELSGKRRLWMLIMPIFIGWSLYMYRSWFSGKWFVV